jgi:hypothetical protein
MKPEFKRRGLIFRPNTKLDWQRSHAALPTALKIGPSEYRIYFTSRDERNRTHVGFFHWNPESPENTYDHSAGPVLAPGRWGCFDDHGVQATSLNRLGDKVYMYYLGWNPSLTTPIFYTAIGLAISEDGGLNFEKHSEAPIMGRHDVDPWMVSGGTVMEFGPGFTMYYLSGISFEIEPVVRSSYDVKMAYSEDGIHWDRKGEVALGLKEGESNISRMSILQGDEGLRSWFPVKRESEKGYRCGYATSVDGKNWTRQDQLAGIAPSGEGWDSGAIDKMWVVEHEGTEFMFYNGNQFGLDGIGIAIRE